MELSENKGRSLLGDHLNLWKAKHALQKLNDMLACCNQHRESNQRLIRCNAPGIDPPLHPEAASSALNEERSITR